MSEPEQVYVVEHEGSVAYHYPRDPKRYTAQEILNYAAYMGNAFVIRRDPCQCEGCLLRQEKEEAT